MTNDRIHTPIRIGDEGVEQMLELAERLRAAGGGRLDEEAIQAVAEAMNQPTEVVRLALKLRTERVRRVSVDSVRSQFLTLEPDVRRYVVTGVAAVFTAFWHVLELRISGPGAAYGLFEMMGLVFLTLGIYNVSTARDPKMAGISGAILAAGIFAANSFFLMLLRMPAEIASFAVLPIAAGGGVLGVLIRSLVDRHRGKLGLRDPVAERQELLRQLVGIQEKLRAAEQSATFLSVDIVGSTRMKEMADPLSVEFTFNEYHGFVERLVRRYGGRIHSTAGDGVTAAFEHPQQAFGAARGIQSGLIELNTFRNRIGSPIAVRQAVHFGVVQLAPGADITTVSFAHVIDIAAHLQKAAPKGTVAVSDSAAAFLPGGAAAVGTMRISAGDVSATVWSPRAAPAIEPVKHSPTAPEPA